MLPSGVEFIAAHPMAGKETSGVKNADDAIFHTANYIVVPTNRNTPDAIRLCCDLGRTLGFKDISSLTAEQHDKMIAFLSQLTHAIAVSLMCAKVTLILCAIRATLSVILQESPISTMKCGANFF